MKVRFKTLHHLTALAVAVAIFSGAAQADDEPRLEGSRNREGVTALHGKPAPDLNLGQWMNGKAVTLKDIKGKIVLIDFWATWCGPCLKAVPHTNEMMKKYGDRGVVIIGVCSPRGGEKLAATVKKYGIKYPVAIDQDGATMKAYLGNSFPDYYVIDRQGNLRWGDIVNSDAEKAIELLLAEDKA